MRVALTMKSRNKKTGPIPVSTTEMQSCPDACPLKTSGCYAKNGPIWFRWLEVTNGVSGTDFRTFTAAIAAMLPGTLWRHNQAGDLPGVGDDIDTRALSQLVKANIGKRGFTYTHKPMNKKNRTAGARANKAGFTINLSANSMGEVDELAALDIAPVVTVLPEEYGRECKGDDWTETLDEYRARTADLPKRTQGGIPVATCPATYLDTNCADCELCARQGRKCAVGFPAHGVQRKAAAAIASK